MDSPRLHRQRVVFLVAVAVIALHVLDDSFIQPEPRNVRHRPPREWTVATRCARARGRRLRRIAPAWRATLALVIGLFGIVAGLEGWHYTMEVGASGDDYTGLIALPAGVVLLLLGVVALWQSRRGEGSRGRRYLRRVLIGVGSVIVAIALVAPFMMAYGYTHLGRAVVPDPKLGGAEYEDVKFETSDGLELEGWYIPSKNGAAVIAFPGRSGPRKSARFLARHGYGVLLFDRRGEGDSEGDPNALGWGGTKDLDGGGWRSFARRPDVDPERIGGIGRSVGGEMLLQFAAETDDLKAVVSEGAGIRSVREAAESSGAEKWAGLPTWGAITAGTAVFSNHSPPPNLKGLVSDIGPEALFLIYADQGQGGENLSADYYEVAGRAKQFWKTDSKHTGGYDAAPREYERRVVNFFRRSLG